MTTQNELEERWRTRIDYTGANAVVTAARLMGKSDDLAPVDGAPWAQMTPRARAALFARANQTGFHAGTEGNDFWHRVACVLEIGGPDAQAVRDAEAELERRRREFMGLPPAPRPLSIDTGQTERSCLPPNDVAQRRRASHDVTLPPAPAVDPKLQRADDVFAAAKRQGVDPVRPWWADTGADAKLSSVMTQEAFEAHEAAAADPSQAPRPATITARAEPKQEKLF